MKPVAGGRHILTWILLLLLFTPNAFGRWWPRRTRPQQFTASAFSVKGTTADGDRTHRGTVAADPAILPLGSRIRIRGAGRYSGIYTVADTGSKVNGRHVDIYMRTEAEAKQFGKKTVTVQVLRTQT